MTLRPLIAVAVLAIAPACGSDDETSPTEQACDVWNDLLLEEPAPTDAEVADELRAIDTEGVDQDVADAITAVASRLESGDDVSTSYQRLSGLCD